MNEPTVALPFDPRSASYALLGLVGFFASSRPHRADVAKTFFLPGFVCPPATVGSPGIFEPGRRAELRKTKRPTTQLFYRRFGTFSMEI